MTAPTRRMKRQWRRRVARALHTKNKLVGLINFTRPGAEGGFAIGIWDDAEDGYPRIIRAPWRRDL